MEGVFPTRFPASVVSLYHLKESPEFDIERFIVAGLSSIQYWVMLEAIFNGVSGSGRTVISLVFWLVQLSPSV